MEHRYIRSSFKRFPTTSALPTPILWGAVGIACPACDSIDKQTPLKYIARLPGAWKAACGIRPTKGQNGHWYATWSEGKLNHEIASINAGHWPAVPYENALPNTNHPTPVPVTPSQQLVNQLFPPHTSTSTTPKIQAIDPLQCFGVKGEMGPTHRITDMRRGNRSCLYKACASCCQTLADQSCPAKGHRKPVASNSNHPFLNRAEVNPSLLNPGASSAASTSSMVNPVPDSHPPASIASGRRIPPQSAQAGGRVAQQFTLTQLGSFFDLRCARDQTIAQNKSFDADESKVVEVTAWLKPGAAPEFFSFVAPKWPGFALQQCQPLVISAALHAGLSEGHAWSRRLSIWHPKKDGWCTMSVDVPTSLPTAPRAIFVRAEHINPDDCPRLNQLIYSTYSETINLHPTGSGLASTSSNTPSALASTSLDTPAASASTSQSASCALVTTKQAICPHDHGIQLDDDITLITTKQAICPHEHGIQLDDNITLIPGFNFGPRGQTGSSATLQPMPPSNGLKEFHVDPVLATPPTPSGQTVKSRWPNLDAPIMDLLEWVKLTPRMSRLSSWDLKFGKSFIKVESTIQRYGRWVGLVKKKQEDRWERWLNEQERLLGAVTILAARNCFHAEYVQAGCPQSKTATPCESQSSQSPQPSKKRKLDSLSYMYFGRSALIGLYILFELVWTTPL